MTTASPRPPAINFEYRGFRNLEDRREYLLSVRTGPDSRDYTLWIAHESFAARQAQLQDGPDICYRKLQLQLAEGHGNDADYIAVTPADLASYKEAHTVPARRKPIKPKLP